MDRVPAISAGMIDEAGAALESRGVMALAAGAISGTPYKIYAIHAGSLAISPVLFLAASFAARLARFAAVCALAYGVSRLLQRRFSLRAQQRIHTAAWVAFYIFYFLSMPN